MGLSMSKIIKQEGRSAMTRFEKKEKGFTIIEVVLVLAIAALIFLMVFVAFPGLQRQQRDSGRKSAVGTVITAVADYAANNRGVLPSGTELDGYVEDLTTANYSVPVKAGVDGEAINATIDTITVYTKAKCAPDGKITTTGASARQFAVGTYLESGGASGVPYCVNG